MRVYDIWTGEPHRIRVSKWGLDSAEKYAIYFDEGQVSGVLYEKSAANARMKEYIKANGLSCLKPIFRSRYWKGYRRDYKK